MNSKCYRKFHNSLTWYSASNDCLSHGGSLAVFIDIGRPSDNRQLTDWLTTSGIYNTYWIGLIRSWWKTTTEGGFELLHKTCDGYVNVGLIYIRRGPLKPAKSKLSQRDLGLWPVFGLHSFDSGAF